MEFYLLEINQYYKLFLLISLLIFFFYHYFNSMELICMCVIGKEENLYVKEFIDYYKKLGFNHIYIYDNNEVNGEKFENVINDKIKEGFVTIINKYNQKYIEDSLEFN